MIDPLLVQHGNCQANFASSNNLAMRLRVSGGTLLDLKGVVLGELSESNAMPQKIRQHDYMNSPAQRVEFETVLPFGPEPQIRRITELVDQTLRFTTDIDLKKHFPAEKLEIDRIVLPGHWLKMVVTEISKSSAFPLTRKELEIPQESGEIWKSAKPFLTLVFVDQSGFTLEIGNGDDLWRWSSAEKTDLPSEFKVVRTANGIEIIRTVLFFNNDSPLHNHKWRFKWHVAWAPAPLSFKEYNDDELTELPWKKSKNTAKSKNLSSNCFTLFNSDSPKVAQVRLDGKILDTPCSRSSTLRNILKRFIRSFENIESPSIIQLRGPLPVICENAAHVGRSERQDRLHWNISSLMEFHFWANRQLSKSGSSFHFLPPKEVDITQLPLAFQLLCQNSAK